MSMNINDEELAIFVPTTKGAISLTKVVKNPTATKFPTKRIDSNAD
ncbi:hypothetical protein [Lysinibacillus sphaericus]